MAELVARGLVVDRGGVRALDRIDLAIDGGEVLAIMGGTGAGKSTLALTIAGLLEPAAGAVDGPARGAVRMLLQRPEATFLADSVREEVALAAIARGEPRTHATSRAAALVTELGLPAGVLDRDPLTLSGGEQRRVALAAVLAADPRVVVLDEPGAGLDRAARADLHDAIRRLHASGRTVVLITHDPDEAALLATRLVVLRGGRIAWDGPPSHVLGSPTRASELGLAVAPEVAVVHAVAAAQGIELAPERVFRPADAIDELARVLVGSRTDHVGSPPPAAAAATPQPQPALATSHAATPLPPLPPLVDARVRTIACAVAVAAALVSTSLVAAAVVAAAAAVVVALARIGRARVRLAVRPLVALAVLLVAMQLLLGGDHATPIAGTRTATHPAAPALLRALQAAAVVLATLALSGATAATDLSQALRRLLAPLAIVRVPVGSIAFVIATALGLVPAFADELERLRLVQRARGIRSASPSLVARMRADVDLAAPLFVAAFRRAHLLADALAVRGVDPESRAADWRARRTPPGDVALLVVAVGLLAVARLA